MPKRQFPASRTPAVYSPSSVLCSIDVPPVSESPGSAHHVAPNNGHKVLFKYKIIKQKHSHWRNKKSLGPENNSWTTSNNLAMVIRLLPLFSAPPSHTYVHMSTRTPRTWDMWVTCWTAELGWLQCLPGLPSSAQLGNLYSTNTHQVIS